MKTFWAELQLLDADYFQPFFPWDPERWQHIKDIFTPRWKPGVCRSSLKLRESFLCSDWVQKSLWSHLLRCCTNLIPFTRVESPFHFMLGQICERNHAALSEKHPFGLPDPMAPYQMKDVANDHRKAKNFVRCLHSAGKTNTSVFRGCTDAEDKIRGVHVDISSALRTSFNTSMKSLQIPNFDPTGCRSLARPWAQLIHLLQWYHRATMPCWLVWPLFDVWLLFFFSCLPSQANLNKITLGVRGGECGKMCGRMDFPLKLKCAVLDFLFFIFFLLFWKKILFLLERFPACTMFPGNPYSPCQCLLLVEEIE